MDLIHESLERLRAQDIRKTPEGWECRCPMVGCSSGKRSFRVAYTGKNGRPGEFWCHKCLRTGDLVTLVMRSRRMSRDQAESIVREVTPYFRSLRKKSKTDWMRPDISEVAPYRRTCSQWLIDRGFEEYWIWYYRIGMDTWSGEIVIPTHCLRGELVGVTRRQAEDGRPYYHSEFPKSEFVWGLDLAIKHKQEKTGYLVEGQADCLGLAPHVDPMSVVSCYGSYLSDEQARQLTRAYDTVVLAYDNDEPGYKAVDRAVPTLRRQGCRDIFVLNYNAGDPGKLPEVEDPELEHESYLAWRMRMRRPTIRRKKRYDNSQR